MSIVNQISLDVDRTALSPEKKKQITARISQVLDNYPMLSYYQGFHDVAMATSSYKELEKLAVVHLRDFMTPEIQPTVNVLNLVPDLLANADPKFAKLVKSIPPHYSISPVITLFCHDTKKSQDIIARVKKFGLGYVIYLYVALVLTVKPDILKQLEGETDPDMVHALFTRASYQMDDVDRNELHKKAETLMKRYPLRRLRAYRQVSPYSAIKQPNLDLTKARKSAQSLSYPPRTKSKLFAVAFGVVVLATMLSRRNR